MFIEERESGGTVKYYLTHSYRDEDGEVRKIRKYLGSNLPDEEIGELRKEAEKEIEKQIEKMKTDVFNFSLSEKEIAQLNEYSDQIRIHHLDKKDWRLFTEDFVYNTNAIEGSTVLKEEVHDILEKEEAEDAEEIETKGVAKAIRFVKETEQDLTPELIRKLHELCFEGSKGFAGDFRREEVVIRNSKGKVVHKGVPAAEVENSLKELTYWYEKNKEKFKPLPLAAIVHNQFEYIHPFKDGNGRVGRLLLNFVLLKNDYPPINILLEDRKEYYETLQEYSDNHDLEPTLKFLIKQYGKTLEGVTTEKGRD